MTEKEYKKDIQPLVEQIMDICRQQKVPCFMSFMLSNDGEDIKENNVIYNNEMFSPRAANIHLTKNDYIAEYIKITNGFVAQPTTRFEDLD